MSNKTWDSDISYWYANKYGAHPSNDKIVALANLKRADRVLDIGCGSGTAVFCTSKWVPQGQAVGIDSSPTMIEIATTRLQQESLANNIQFIEGAAEQIPTSENQFDVVLALNSLHHWTNVEQGIQEVSRVLQENGRFLIGEEQFEDRINEWTPQKVTQFLTQAGFKKLSHFIIQFEDSVMDFYEFEK